MMNTHELGDIDSKENVDEMFVCCRSKSAKNIDQTNDRDKEKLKQNCFVL